MRNSPHHFGSLHRPPRATSQQGRVRSGVQRAWEPNLRTQVMLQITETNTQRNKPYTNREGSAQSICPWCLVRDYDIMIGSPREMMDELCVGIQTTDINKSCTELSWTDQNHITSVHWCFARHVKGWRRNL